MISHYKASCRKVILNFNQSFNHIVEQFTTNHNEFNLNVTACPFCNEPLHLRRSPMYYIPSVKCNTCSYNIEFMAGKKAGIYSIDYRSIYLLFSEKDGTLQCRFRNERTGILEDVCSMKLENGSLADFADLLNTCNVACQLKAIREKEYINAATRLQNHV